MSRNDIESLQEKRTEMSEQIDIAVALGAERRASRLTQAEVLNESCVFAEIGFAPEDVDDDCAHAGGNLFASPAWRRGGEVGLMTHDPAGEVADGLQVLRKFGAPILSQFAADKGGQHAYAGKKKQWKQVGKRGKAWVGKLHCTRARKQHHKKPQRFKPLRTTECRWFFDPKFRGDLLHERPPLGPQYQYRKVGRRSNVRALPSAVPQKRFPQQVEGTLREAGFGIGNRYFALNQINQLPRGEDFLRLGVLNADVKSIFNRHYDFHSIQSHVECIGSAAGERQGVVL